MHASVLLALELMPAELDSALNLLKSAEKLQYLKNGIARADFFNAYGVYYWYSGEYEEAIEAFSNTVEMNERPAILPKIAKAANNMGCLYSKLGKAEMAKKYLAKSLEIDTYLGNDYGATKTMYDLGILFMRLDQYDLALQYLMEVANYQEAENDLTRLAYTLISLGNVYLHIGNPEKAVENYLRAASLSESQGYTANLITAYNNLTAIYCDSAVNFDKALYYANKGLELANQEKDYNNLLSFNANIGEAYSSINLPDSALHFYTIAKGYIDNVHSPIIHAELFVGIGNVYARNKKYDSARHYLQKAIKISKEIQSLSCESDAYLKLSEIDSAQGNSGLALSHYRRGIALRDSIWNRESKSRISELEIKYESDKQKLLINNLEQENKFIKYVNIWVIASIVLFVFAAVILLAFLRKRNIINEQKLIIQKQENAQFQSKLEANKQELTGKALTIVKLEEVIKQFRAELCLLMPQVNDGSARKIKEALSTIDSNAKGQHMWKEFESRFNELNDGFINKLTTLHPSLSPAEIRLCAMLRMQLSSKEIAELSNRSPRTVEYTRTNIRKKMGLNPGDNLTKHLLSI